LSAAVATAHTLTSILSSPQQWYLQINQ